MFTTYKNINLVKKHNDMEDSKIYLNYLISVRNDFYNRGFIKQAEKVQNDINKILQEKQNKKHN